VRCVGRMGETVLPIRDTCIPRYLYIEQMSVLMNFSLEAYAPVV